MAIEFGSRKETFDNFKVYETMLAGRPFKVEMGKMCGLSNASALIRYGETCVMCNVVMSPKPREGVDFFPLNVEYEEKLYAAGRIPGSFMRREGRPGERAILTSRVVDRPMRPLFPKEMRNDVCITMTVMSLDPDCSPEIAGMIGASLVTAVSDIPWNGPIGGVQVGLVDGEIVLNPTQEQRKVSDLALTVAATMDKIVMIEAGANEVDEDTMLNAIKAAHVEIKKIITFINGIVAERGKPKIDFQVENPQWGYNVRGILDDNIARGTTYKGVKVIGSVGNLLYILPENKLDEIAITLGLEEYYKLEKIVSECEKSGVHTKFIPDYGNIIPTKPYTEDLLGLPVINIRYVPLSNTFNALVKRCMDIVGSLICIVLFSPIMLLTAIAVKVTSKGPLIFKQERVGLHNEPFRMYKFRTMYVQTEEEERKGWTHKDDPRITKIGRFLRKTSLDEFPQLFNVLKGDMSLVGPRPERPQYVEKFREEIPRYMIKHQVRPGMTGWAQVNGYRGDTSIRKRIEHDLYYIENWTIGLDIKILFLTVFKGFINKNAY